MSKIKLIVILLTGFLFVVSCAGIRTYRQTDFKNLHINKEISSGSIFSKISASLDIYSVDKACQPVYQGTVELPDNKLDVGIPQGRLSYLVFEFETWKPLAGASSSVSYDGLLMPRPGIDYDINVTYKDAVYMVTVQERQPSGKKSRTLELEDIATCRNYKVQ
jgi:hypothetical protein